MTVINLEERAKQGDNKERPILPTDVYRMKILEAKLEENTFAKPNKDGSKPMEIVLTWEMNGLTDEQAEVADERGEDWSDVRVWQHMAPYYGDVKDGGPSKFKAFIEQLRKIGYLTDFDLTAFDIDSFVGVEMKVSVLEYTKTMGPNAGSPGNKVAGVAPIRKGARNAPQPVKIPATTEDEDLPF